MLDQSTTLHVNKCDIQWYSINNFDENNIFGSSEQEFSIKVHFLFKKMKEACPPYISHKCFLIFIKNVQ